MDNLFTPPEVTTQPYQRLAIGLSKIGRNHPFIGLTDPDKILDRLILTSLLSRPLLDPDRPIVDVGAGVGIPGLPLAISEPDHSITLVEPKERCIPLIRWLVDQLPELTLSIINKTVESATLSDFTPQLVSRAAMDWPMLKNHSPDGTAPIIRWGGESVPLPPEDPPDWRGAELETTHSRLERPQTLLWWGPEAMFHVKQSAWSRCEWTRITETT